MSERFTMVKRGYDPTEVDNYIETLEQVIKSYKDKDNTIKNAIISAQMAADNIIKNAHAQADEIRRATSSQISTLLRSIDGQRMLVKEFEQDYNRMLEKYVKNIDSGDISLINQRINELEVSLNAICGNEDPDDGDAAYSGKKNGSESNAWQSELLTSKSTT